MYTSYSLSTRKDIYIYIYILLHSNQATHLQCDSLRFRGRFFYAEIRNIEDGSHEGRMEMRPRLVFSRSSRAVRKNK